MRYAKPTLLALCILMSVGFSVHHACATQSLVINEIMYDPAGTDTNREWIEVYNAGTTALDISHFSLLTDGVSSTHHSLTAVTGTSLDPGAYAVIVQNVDSFKADYPSYTGLIFDSSWTGLTASSGKTIVLLDASGTVLDQVAYDPTLGATNDGNSLSRGSSGIWSAVSPTPGAQNSTQSTSTTDTSTNTQTQSTGGLPAPTTPNTPPPKVVAHMDAVLQVPKHSTTGMNVRMQASVTGLVGETRTYGVFHYAFGDGEAVDTETNSPVNHIYTYPGTYYVTFEYRSNRYVTEPELTVHATIEVIDAVLALGIDSDARVTVTNTSDDNADVSHWILTEHIDSQDTHEFVFPSGTVILPDKKIVLGTSLTHFVATALASVTLSLPSAQVIADSQTGKPLLSTYVTTGTQSAVTTAAYLNETPTTHIVAVGETAVPVETLGATALLGIATLATHAASPYEGGAETHKPVWPFVLGLIGIIVIALYALYEFDILGPSNIEEKSDTQKIADEITIVE